jgi:RNA polymerase sigma-70 factor (ECF subfamily)
MFSKAIRWKNGTASAPHSFDNSASAPLQSRQVEQQTALSMTSVQDIPAVLDEASDEHLALRIAARDMDAFGRVYDRYCQPVFAMAGHMLGVNDAEEAAQEIFIRLWRKAAQYDPARGPFSHWFMSIARNYILDTLRARGERRRLVAAEQIEALLAEAPDPTVDVLEQVWQNQRGSALAQALQRIPHEQRRVIVLAYFGGMSQSEISMHLNVPLGTVKKRIRLGLQKLRAALSPQTLLDFDGELADTFTEGEC